MERLCRVFLDKLIMAHQSRRWIATSKCSSCLQHIFFFANFFYKAASGWLLSHDYYEIVWGVFRQNLLTGLVTFGQKA